jgi:hypothetical protein
VRFCWEFELRVKIFCRILYQLLQKVLMKLHKHYTFSNRLGNLAEYYLLSSPVIQRPASTKEICERNANIVERDTGRNPL